MGKIHDTLLSMDTTALTLFIYLLIGTIAVIIVSRILKAIKTYIKKEHLSFKGGKIGFEDGKFNLGLDIDKDTPETEKSPEANSDLVSTVIPLDKIVGITQSCMVQTLQSVNNISDIKEEYHQYVYSQIDEISLTAAQLCSIKYKEILLEMDVAKTDADLKYYKVGPVVENGAKNAFLEVAISKELSFGYINIAPQETLDSLAAQLSKTAAKALKSIFVFVDSEELSDLVLKRCEVSVRNEIISFVNNVKQAANRANESIQKEENIHLSNITREISTNTGVCDKNVRELLNSNGENIWLQYQP